MRVLSLCSGYAGLEMGLELAGIDVELIAYAEVDKYASQVMAHHHPGVPNLGDIKQHAHFTKEAIGDIELLTAGYPCQPFSQAGKGLGAQDPRHLWPFIAEAIRQLRPRIVLLENVRGHVTKGLKEVIADLADLGYVGSWRCIRASDIGACHRRERVFIVAYLSADPLGEELEGAQPAERHVLLAGGGGIAPDSFGDSVRVRSGGVGSQTSQPQGATQERQRDRVDEERQRLRIDDGDGGANAAANSESLGREWGGEHGSGGKDLRTTVADTHRPAGDTSGTASEEVRESAEIERSGRCDRLDGVDWGKFIAAIERWERILGRPAPIPTEGDKHRLNPAFVEWMMGLPEGHVTGIEGISRSQQLKILGNGVVPQQAALACRLSGLK